MTGKNGRHLSGESREAVEAGIRNGDSARAIAKRIGAGPSAATREARAHRTVRERKPSPREKAPLRCANREACRASGTAHPKCSTRPANCKDRGTRRCILTRPDCKPRTRETAERRPYVCPGECPKRGRCGLPKCGCDAGDADAAYRETPSSSRSGICCTQEGLDAMNAIVAPPAKRGRSLEAI